MSIAPGRTKNREQKAWDRLGSLEDDSGLGISEAFDEVEVDSSLPRNVPAATHFDDYDLMMGDIIDEEPEALLKLNDSFFYLDPGKQDEVLLHESMHGLEGKNRLIPQLRYKKGISQEFEQDLTTAFSYGGIDQVEGAVQALAGELNDSNVPDYFRRYEIRETHDRWRQKGLEPESELSEEIGDFRQEMIGELADREVYDVEVSDGLYFEYGQFMGEDYSIAVTGENSEVYGPDIADQYLEDLYEGIEDEDIEGLEIDYEDGYGPVEFDEDFVPDRAMEDLEEEYEDEYQEPVDFMGEDVPEPVDPEVDIPQTTKPFNKK